MFKSLKALSGIAAASLLLVACSASEPPVGGPDTIPPEDPETLTVFAAASLNKVFPRIAEEVFAEEHPNVDVSFSFEGSSTLVDQIKQGAPADVFASADIRNMDKALEAEVVEKSDVFTVNELVLIVPAGNPAGVTGLDESLQDAKVIQCHPEVPCGNLTGKVLEDAGVSITPVSEEQKVTDVRGKIESGEGDAGFVYLTDAMAAGDLVEIVPISVRGVNEYPIAVVKDSPNAELAQAFIDAVMSEEGAALLAEFGFSKP